MVKKSWDKCSDKVLESATPIRHPAKVCPELKEGTSSKVPSHH